MEKSNSQYARRESENSTNKSKELSSSENSNNSNQNKPYKQRTNLPSQNGCISMENSSKGEITSTSKWFILKNSCAYPVNVSWCTGLSCINSTAAATISGGSSYETWGKTSLDGRIDLDYHACQLLSGNDEVYSDWRNKQCWANIQMN